MALSQEMQERLAPTHLLPDTETPLKDQVEESVATETKEAKVDGNDPKLQKEYTFDFNHEGVDGKRYRGQFTNKILTVRERQLVGLARARLAGGLPRGALDELTEELNLCLAHVSFSLTPVGDAPEWAKNLDGIEDFTVLQALYEEVMAHEARFYRR